MTAWAHVATLAKTKNLEGGFVVRPAPGLPFLLQEGMKVNFVPPVIDAPREAVVKQIQHFNGDSSYVLFHGVDSIECAERLAGCSCLVLKDDLPDFSSLSNEELDIVGYEVIDEEKGLLGKVSEFIENKHQCLISVDAQNGELLIPYVDEFVLDIDEEQQAVSVLIPASLIAL